MSRSLRLVSAGVVLVLLTVPALAQDRPGRGQGRFGVGRSGFQIDKPTLLGSDQVRGELKITEEQGKKIDPILAAYREGSRGAFSSLRDLSPEEREKKREEMTKKVDELRKKAEGQIDAALDEGQRTRLSEIALQQQGVDGLVGENVVASLKLSPEQVDKIKAAAKTRDEEVRKLMSPRGGSGRPGGGDDGGGAELRDKMQKIRKQADDSALAVLSKEQQEAFDKLKGKPFELDRASLFRGGRGGGGGRRGAGERQRPPADA